MLAAFNEINTVRLLEQPAVHADPEIALTPEQVGRLAPLLDRLHTHSPAPTSPSKGGKRRQAVDLAEACRREAGNILTAAQDRRLRQIFLQGPGPHILAPSVLTALGLTEPQKAEVRRVQAEATQASLRLVATAESRDEGLAQLEKVWRQAIDQVVADLTDTQRQRWTEMLGLPVKGDVHFPLPTSHSQRSPR